MEDKLAYLVS